MENNTVTVGRGIFGLPSNLYDLGFDENTKMELSVGKHDFLGVIIDGVKYHIVQMPKNGYELMRAQ